VSDCKWIEEGSKRMAIANFGKSGFTLNSVADDPWLVERQKD